MSLLAQANQGSPFWSGKRALLSVSDKTGVVELARALSAKGVEIISTGGTAQVLQEAGIAFLPVEQITGMPEAFQGRMKTLSYELLAGILYRRGDASDEADRERLSIHSLDIVVVNFYPFESTWEKFLSAHDAADCHPDHSNRPAAVSELVEQIDIGGPTLVRAAAKNADHVVVLTSPAQYHACIDATGYQWLEPEFLQLRRRWASAAWQRVSEMDDCINLAFHPGRLPLRYGENPHQRADFFVRPDSTIDWLHPRTSESVSYNNILDISAGVELTQALQAQDPRRIHCVIIKHNGPCGVASAGSVREALHLAWNCDPVSAFGGVVVLSSDPQPGDLDLFQKQFVEALVVPGISEELITEILPFRKKLKILEFAIGLKRSMTQSAWTRRQVEGGELRQEQDQVSQEELRSLPENFAKHVSPALSMFGLEVVRSLRSNAVAVVGELEGGALVLLGSGQGQPNRVEAIEKLLAPRLLATRSRFDRIQVECAVSDAFFPFRDSVDSLARLGVRFLLQPGGSRNDASVMDAARENAMEMVFTGRRHFTH